MNVKTQGYSVVYKNNDLLSRFVCTRDRNENLFFFTIILYVNTQLSMVILVVAVVELMMNLEITVIL